MKIDAHHHLWDLNAVHYPWLMAKGEVRFFGDPASIQRDYLLEEFTSDAKAHGFEASVHIQVGAQDGMAEAAWVDGIAQSTDWPMHQVAFCDLASPNLAEDLAQLQALPSVRGVRQIIGRAPGEDALTGTQELISSKAFGEGLAMLEATGLRFDLQLLPELMVPMADVLSRVPKLPVALCHAGSPYDRSQEGIAQWAQALESLSSQPQIMAKLSGLGMFAHGWQAQDFAPITDVMLSQFGVERLMFGSNFPVCSLTSDYARLISAYEDLIPAHYHKHIFGETAAAFYDF